MTDDGVIDEAKASIVLPYAQYKELVKGIKVVTKTEVRIETKHTGAGRGIACGLGLIACPLSVYFMLNSAVGWGWFIIPTVVCISIIGQMAEV